MMAEASGGTGEDITFDQFSEWVQVGADSVAHVSVSAWCNWVYCRGTVPEIWSIELHAGSYLCKSLRVHFTKALYQHTYAAYAAYVSAYVSACVSAHS